MTLAHRRLFREGGFGYLVFHNQKGSDKAFVVKYDEEYLYDNADSLMQKIIR